MPPTHHRGTCLVLIERSIVKTLSFEITRLMDDLQGDGWTVDTISVERTDAVPQVKNKILNWLQNISDRHKALFKDTDIVNIENLTNLDQCGDELFWFSCFPLKIENCEGFSIRAIAWYE